VKLCIHYMHYFKDFENIADFYFFGLTSFGAFMLLIGQLEGRATYRNVPLLHIRQS